VSCTVTVVTLRPSLQPTNLIHAQVSCTVTVVTLRPSLQPYCRIPLANIYGPQFQELKSRIFWTPPNLMFTVGTELAPTEHDKSQNKRTEHRHANLLTKQTFIIDSVIRTATVYTSRWTLYLGLNRLKLKHSGNYTYRLN
jgi:hypothetical protein